METLNQIIQALIPYLITLVTAFAAYVVAVIKNKLTQKLDTETKRQVAEDTVNYIQQVYSDLDGKEKLRKGLDTAITWLNQKGINITEAEMTILLEAAIKGAKEGWLSIEAKELEVEQIKALNESEMIGENHNISEAEIKE